MDQHSTYRRTYPNKRLDEAYHRFVRGEASLRQLVKSSKVSLRTLQRYSSQHQWVEEMEEIKARASVNASLLTQMAAMTPAVASDGASDVPGVTAKDIILGVLKRQQTFWDRVEARTAKVFDAIEAELEKPGVKAITMAIQLKHVLDIAATASTNTRKAYGIPDVTKLEFEDKTPAAKRHADIIRARKVARLGMTSQPAASESLPN